MQSLKITLIDSYGFFYKTYFALHHIPLKTRSGEITSVIHSFFTFLHDIIIKQKPDKLICILDAKGKTFRHERFPEYKANRSPMPEELRTQITAIEKLLHQLGIPTIKKQGYEADDLIAHYAIKAHAEKQTVEIFSSDKDILQLVSDKVTIVKSGKRNEPWQFVREQEVVDKYNIPLHSLVDYFALVGDSADNIPGVRGIGPVMASKLINTYLDLDNLYDSLTKENPSVRKKLELGRDDAFLSRDLIDLRTTNITDLPALNDIKETAMQSKEIVKAFKHYELTTLLKKFDLSAPERIAATRTLKEAITSVASNNTTTGHTKPNDPSLTSLLLTTFPFTEHFTRHDVNTKADFTDVVAAIEANKYMVFDLETTSLTPFDAEIISIAIACEKHSYFMLCERKDVAISSSIVLGDTDFPTGTLAITLLKAILEAPHIKKIGHNLKYEYEILKCHGITLAGLYHDTMIYEYLKDADKNRLKLEDVFKHYTQADKSDYKSLFKVKGRKTIFDVPFDEFRTYALEDVEATSLIYNKQLNTLHAKEKSVYEEIERPLISVLGEIELAGVVIDEAFFSELDKTVSKNITSYQEQILALAGEPFNVNSTKQLQHILFDKLAIRKVKKTKTGFSTDITVLEELKTEHPIIPLLLEYRKAAKLLSTYIKTLPKLVHPKTGRIHTNYHQAVVGTGRLSSQNPNLQNIPIGKESLGIRKGFIAPPGYHVVSLDYSQVELRVLAFLSKDPTLINAYTNNQDIHAYTAKLIFNKELSQITKEERAMGKTVNFSLIYGVSSFTLAQRFNISQGEAKEFMRIYFENYPTVTMYRDQILEKARKNTYIETYYGRKRYVRDINAKDKLSKLRGERIAFNAVIQGTAADIMKLAMIEIERHRRDGTFTGELVMQVHDELVFYIKAEKAPHESNLLKKTLKNIKPFEKILDVDIEIGTSWEK
ncbi:DNA polymerase I [Spirochaetota bacterium]|nr:DNA polymerase I [Spirochaetota bacterium]